jgi:hypothetical protein
MQSRRQEAQLMSFQMLCPFLQHLTTTTSGNNTNNDIISSLASTPPGLVAAILDTLRVAITTSNVEIFSSQSSTPGMELGSEIATLLVPFISLASDATALQNNYQLVILAMACLEDLINRPHPPPLKQRILTHVLPFVWTLCRSWNGTAATDNTAVSTTPVPWGGDLLGVFTRLLVQALQHSFTFAAANAEIAAGVQEVLRDITNCASTTAAGGVRSSGGGGNSCSGDIDSLLAGVLAASEAWHAVLTYMEDLEASNWNENDSFDINTETNNDNAGGSVAEKQLSSFYKQGILHFSHLLLSIFFTESTQNLPSPPFLLQNLSTHPGSGAALEDWVAAVGDNNEDFQAENSQDKAADAEDASNNDAEEGVDDVLSSEAHVFAQQVEYFIAHATSSYHKDLVPVLFKQLAPAMTAAAQARQGTDHGVVYLTNFRAEFALKLLSRCAPYLPTRNLTSSLPDGINSGLEEQEGSVYSLTGSHVVQLLQALLHFGGEQLNIVRSTEAQAQQAQQAQQHQRILMAVVLDTVVGIYRTISPIMTSWLPQIMLQNDGTDPDVEILVSQLLQAVIEFVAAGVDTSVFLSNLINSNTNSGSNTGGGGYLGSGSKKLAIAASQTLLSITSIALSSGMKPPVGLLHNLLSLPAVGSLSAAVAAAVQSQTSSLPRATLRSLFVSLSDLVLRSWGAALQASNVDVNERKTALAAVTAPLLHVVQSAAAQGQLTPTSSTAAPVSLAQVYMVGSLATDIIESYVGSSKVVRGAVFEVFAQPMLVAVMAVLKNWKNNTNNNNNSGNDGVSVVGSKNGLKNRLGTVSLNFISSCLRAFPAELGTASIGDLLSALVAAFSTMNDTTINNNTAINAIEASLDADVVLLSIIASALQQGGNKHAALVMPGMQFGLQINEKAALCGATHIKSEVLASLLGVMTQHWRSLGGGSGGSGGGGEGTAAESQPPAAVAEATLTHISSFLSDAASTKAIPSASDVNLVLEALIDIQSRSKIFWKPSFSRWKDLTMESTLTMLLTRMYTGAQESLIDTLYQLAAANWSHFLLSFLPAFAEKNLAGLGARGAELAAGLGSADMDALAFEKGVLAFVNDALYWEKRV